MLLQQINQRNSTLMSGYILPNKYIIYLFEILYELFHIKADFIVNLVISPTKGYENLVVRAGLVVRWFEEEHN